MVPAALICCFFAITALHFEIHDFANYYFSGHFLARGTFTSSMYFPYEFNKAISNTGQSGIFASYAPNTPFLAVLFYPFSFLSAGAAKMLFNALSIVCFLYSLKRLASFYKIDAVFILMLPVLFFVPIKNGLLFGQVYFLLFFFLSESLLAYEKKQSWKTAIFLSLAILLKVFPIFLILIFLSKKQFRLLCQIGVAGCGLLLFSALFTGFDIWIFYLVRVLPKASNGEIATAFVSNYQSVFMFLKQLLVYDSNENKEALYYFPVLFSALAAAFKISLVAIGFFISRKNANTLLIFGYWIFAIILLSPYGSSYTLILLLFPFLAMVKSDISTAKKISSITVLFLANNLPLALFLNWPFPFSYPRLFLLFSLFVAMLWVSCENVNWKIVGSISILPLLLAVFITKKQPDTSVTVLIGNTPILIHDYIVDRKGLTYYYWDENGENSGFFHFKNSVAKFITLKNSGIPEFAADKSNKLEAVLVDGKTLFYLSDKDRGIGFYTLRKIKLDSHD
jgi:hypothetical protein